MKASLSLITMFYFLLASGVESNAQVHKAIDNYISEVMAVDEIPGMAVAVIQKGSVIHRKNYGLANLPHRVPVTDSTLFRAYSTTKLLTSVAIFQLIEEDRLALHDPIEKYIENLPIAWKGIEVGQLLAHSSGLPDYKDIPNQAEMSDSELMSALEELPIAFENGSSYKYNQTNFWFLKLIIERSSKLGFDQFVKLNQFKEAEAGLVFASNSLIAVPNRVPKYQFNKTEGLFELSSYNDGPRSLAGNGLNVTLENLIIWNQALDQNRLVSQESKQMMMSPYNYKKSDYRFGYSWGIFGPSDKRYYGFPGGGVSALMKFIDHDLTIIILSNGFKNRPIISSCVSYISGLVDTTLIRKDRMLNEDLRLAFLRNYETAESKFFKIKSENSELNFERVLNQVGYTYMFDNQLDKAIRIFRLHTEVYPDSYNAYDSLGEAYFLNDQYDMSMQNYQASLRLNPNNDNAKQMIQKISALD